MGMLLMNITLLLCSLTAGVYAPLELLYTSMFLIDDNGISLHCLPLNENQYLWNCTDFLFRSNTVVDCQLNKQTNSPIINAYRPILNDEFDVWHP
jgi:hypothetical protein